MLKSFHQMSVNNTVRMSGNHGYLSRNMQLSNRASECFATQLSANKLYEKIAIKQ